MIIRYFDTLRSSSCPNEADPPLLIDAYRILSLPRTRQFFQSVAWRRSEIVQIRDDIQKKQKLLRSPDEVWRKSFLD